MNELEADWKTILIVALLFVGGLGVGYGFSSAVVGPEEQSIKIVGSTTVLPLAEECAKNMMNEYAYVTISVSGGGSGTGYSALINGEADIADASRTPKQKEIDDASDAGVVLNLHTVAIDVLTVVVNTDVATDLKLTMHEIGKIFAGEYDTWGEVNTTSTIQTPDASIKLVDRESGSGTRGVFVEICLDPWGLQVESEGTTVVGSNQEMAETVKGQSNAIGYVGLAYLKEGLTAVKTRNDSSVDWFNPEDMKETGNRLSDYPLSRPLYMATDGNLIPGSLTARFIHYVQDSHDTVREIGYFPVSFSQKVS